MRRPRAAHAALALYSALAVGCGSGTHSLYQISGDSFVLGGPAPPRDPFRYGPFDPARPPEERFARLLARLRERLRARDVPGGAIAVLLGGRLAFSAGVGVLRDGSDAPVTATTRFRTASISKMLLAATVLSFVERDGLELGARLTDLVPYFRRRAGYDASRVTLEMLLTHTAGVPDTLGCAREPYALRPTIEGRASDALWSPPGALFNYSNAHYALLALALSERTGRPWEDLVAERVFQPARMTHASYVAAEGAADVAAGHSARREVVWTHPTDCEASRAAGGVIASVTDYARFVEALLAGGGAMLRPDSVAAMLRGRAVMTARPRRLYGYGLTERTRDGLVVFEHGGFASGFVTTVQMVPERGFGVVVFVNGPMMPDEVADAAMSAFLGTPEDPPPRVATPSASWGEYAGTYDDRAGALGRFELGLEGAHLEMRAQERQLDLASGLRGEFVRGADGGVEFFVTRVGVAQRVPGP